jgi:hypothetical protein
LIRVDLLTADEHHWFTTALVMAHEVRPQPRGRAKRPCSTHWSGSRIRKGTYPPGLSSTTPECGPSPCLRPIAPVAGSW